MVLSTSAVFTLVLDATLRIETMFEEKMNSIGLRKPAKQLNEGMKKQRHIHAGVKYNSHDIGK